MDNNVQFPGQDISRDSLYILKTSNTAGKYTQKEKAVQIGIGTA
ncbi:hypothetical protein [Salinimicrobium soli]